MIKGAVKMRKKTADEMWDEAGLITRDTEVKSKGQLMKWVHMTQPAESPELGVQVVEVMRKA